jgi:hypothetical protein
MRYDYLLYEVEVGRGGPTRSYTTQEVQHFVREWRVARQFAKICYKQNQAEINAQNNK